MIGGCSRLGEGFLDLCFHNHRFRLDHQLGLNLRLCFDHYLGLDGHIRLFGDDHIHSRLSGGCFGHHRLWRLQRFSAGIAKDFAGHVLGAAYRAGDNISRYAALGHGSGDGPCWCGCPGRGHPGATLIAKDGRIRGLVSTIWTDRHVQPSFRLSF